MCMTTTPAADSATTAGISGSPRSPVTSLMIAAPASRHARATAALLVSTEIIADVCHASSATTGSTRRSSSSAGTGCEPGRVDSPPTSRMSAPSDASRRPCATASAGSRNRLPSEKLSGVTLTMPMTSGRSAISTVRPRQDQVSGAMEGGV